MNYPKINRARFRKDLRKVYLKIKHKVRARFLRKARTKPSQGLRKVRARSAQGPRKARARPAQGPRKAPPQARPQKNKCVSNDRSRHDDSNGPRIVKIGAILAIFEHFKVFAIQAYSVRRHTVCRW